MFTFNFKSHQVFARASLKLTGFRTPAARSVFWDFWLCVHTAGGESVKVIESQMVQNSRGFHRRINIKTPFA